MLIEIRTFSFKMMRSKSSSLKWWPFCFGLNVLNKSMHGLHHLLCLLTSLTIIVWPYPGSRARWWKGSKVADDICLRWRGGSTSQDESPRQSLAKRRRIFMVTSSNGNIFRVTGRLCGEFSGPGEFPAQRPVTRSFDVFFDLRPNKRLSKQPWGWRFETLSWSLWRHCNDSPLSGPS